MRQESPRAPFTPTKAYSTIDAAWRLQRMIRRRCDRYCGGRLAEINKPLLWNQILYIFVLSNKSIYFSIPLLIVSVVLSSLDHNKMSPGIADQLLLLIDEIEELTMEIFTSGSWGVNLSKKKSVEYCFTHSLTQFDPLSIKVQNNTPSDNLVEMLIKKDRQLAQLLQTANEQKQLYDKIENVGLYYPSITAGLKNKFSIKNRLKSTTHGYSTFNRNY